MATPSGPAETLALRSASCDLLVHREETGTLHALGLAKWRALSAQASQVHTRSSGWGWVMTSVMTATDWAPAAIAAEARSGVKPPMAMRGRAPMRAFHSLIRSSPCGAHL